MDNRTPEFASELVDAQIDWLLANQPQSLSTAPNKRLVNDLQQMYLNDERSLGKVWQRLELENNSQSNIQGWQNIPGMGQYIQDTASAKVLNMERKRPMHQVRSHSLTRTFSIVAAICVVALIVGGMLFILNLVYPHQSPNTVANVTPQDIYASDPDSVFKIDAQTHQMLWRQPLKGSTKIIPAKDAIYVLQGATGSDNPGAVLKLDASNGKTLWTRTFTVPQTDHKAATTDIALIQNHIYVSWEDVYKESVLDPIQAEKALKPAQISVLKTTDGSQITSYPLNSLVKHIWFIAANTEVIAASTDGGLMVSNLTGKPLWHAHFPASTNRTVNSIQLINGLLYAAVFSMDETRSKPETTSIRAYKATGGQQVWQGPALSNNSPSFFTVDQNIIYFGETFTAQPGQKKPDTGRIYAYDTQSNKQLWNMPVAGAMLHQPYLSDGVIYLAIDSGAGNSVTQQQAHIVALNAATGTVRWQRTLVENYIAGFTVSDGVIYAGSYNFPPSGGISWGRSYVIKAADGTSLWEDSQRHLFTIALAI